MPVLYTVILQTKFEMSSFIRSKDIAWAPNVDMGHVTLTTPTWGTVSHEKANTSRGRLVYKIEVSSCSRCRDILGG